tara:strand:- start:5798 stop:8386 length:2589 start_codon:yes stop_codon:yes gene_type:complete
MGPQNLNNYYFNRLDAKLNYSAYYDFFLAADERDFNTEVVYSPYIIGVQGNSIFTTTGGSFASDKLTIWLDLNSTGSTHQPTLYCNDYLSNNTVLSLSYWDEARPNQHDVDCRCIKCETKGFEPEGSFVESICDIGLTGIDNGLTYYMSGNTTIPDLCLTGFTSLTAMSVTVTATTGANCLLTPISWSPNTPGVISGEPAGTFRYPCTGSTNPSISGVTSASTDNFGIINSTLKNNYVGCCFFTAGTAYNVTVKDAKLTPQFGAGVFTANTLVNLGYTSAPCKLETLKLWKSMPEKYKYDPLHYDRRFKVHAVTGYTDNPYNYNIVSVSGISEGYYQQLYGGFYQGFFKLDDYPYEVSPTRPECGWTTECLLKIRTGSTICSRAYNNTLNQKYPNNKGFFWYIGTRAENKYHNVYSGECGLTTCAQLDFSCTGSPVYLTASASTVVDEKCYTRRSYITATTYNSGIDVWSNSLGLRLTDDYRIGYRAIYYTGNCITSGTCVTGLTYTSGFTVTEKYSDNIICQLTGSTQSEPWILVSARFRRNYCYDNECDLENEGGVNDLLEPVVPETINYINTATPDYGNLFKPKKDIKFTKKWTDERWLRKGTLTIFVNGRPVFEDDDFEEIIPRRLNTDPPKQVGVPFNMSWGGGSQGLIENLTFMSGCTGGSAGPRARTCRPYTQDASDLNLLIEENFAGTWDGGISQMRYYIEPLGADEIMHNYLVNKDRYNLIDCSCMSTTCLPGRTIYLTEGDSLDIILEYNNTDVTYTTDVPPVCVNHQNNLAVDRLNLYVDPSYTGVKMNNAITDNVKSYIMYRHRKSTGYAAEVVTFPFTLTSKDILNVYVTERITCTKVAKVTILGNLYK